MEFTKERYELAKEFCEIGLLLWDLNRRINEIEYPGRLHKQIYETLLKFQSIIDIENFNSVESLLHKLVDINHEDNNPHVDDENYSVYLRVAMIIDYIQDRSLKDELFDYINIK